MHDLQMRDVADLLRLVERHIDDHVQAAGQDLGELGLAIWHKAELHLGDFGQPLGAALEVVRIALQADVFADRMLSHPEGAGADRLLVHALGANFGVVFVRVNGHADTGEVVDGGRERLLRDDSDPVLVQLHDLLDPTDLLGAGDLALWVRREI